MTEINLSDLSFLAIKESLKTFLRSQTEFKDYNFEGSALTVLIDLLAKNTHYYSYFSNALANEMFIDTAQLRKSAVKLARHLNYTPNSKHSARATLSVTGDRYLSAYETRFFTSIDGVAYTFTPTEEVLLSPSDSPVEVTLIEGIPNTMSFIVDYTSVEDYIINEPNLDTNTLSVIVKASQTSSDYERYTLAEDVNYLTSDSKVFFFDETDEGYYRIYFGDGIIGKKPANASYVQVSYLISHGEDVNGANSFTAPDDCEIDEVVSSASGGSERDTLETIRFRAPRYYQSQGRLVTTSDYENVLPSLYPNIESVSCWGGEDNDPPAYGKIFIALKPSSGLTISETQKEYIKENILKPRNVATVQVEILDPDYIYLLVNSTVYYDSTKTTNRASTLKENVITTISDYGDVELDKFGNTLRYSKLVKDIDDTDVSINGNVTSLRLKKKIENLNVTTPMNYTLNFSNELHQGNASTILTSSEFYYMNSRSEVVVAFLEDDSNGNVIIATSDSGVKTVIVPNAGTINYKTGKVELLRFKPEIELAELEVIVLPKNSGVNDVYSIRDQILTILEEDISVSVIKE